MSSPWLTNLKVRVDHLVMASVALALVGGGVWMWRSLRVEDQQAELDDGLERIRGRRSKTGSDAKMRGEGPNSARIFKGFHASARAEIGEGERVYMPPPQADPGDLDASEAVDAYESVVADLEQALETERELSEREQGELYNRASGSLTALTAWADPKDPHDRALMDDAYIQLKSLMRELDIQPPRHNPDPAPMPR